MKRKGTGKGVMAIGSLRTDGITTYMKQGRLIIRSANPMERRHTAGSQTAAGRGRRSAGPDNRPQSTRLGALDETVALHGRPDG